MLNALLSTTLLLGLIPGADAPTKEQIGTWIQELAGEQDAQHANLLSKAWPGARPAVIAALARHAQPAVRSWCARIVGDHAGEIEQRALARSATRDGLPRVRAVALLQLSKRPDGIYVEALRGLLEWESDRGNLLTLLGLVERTGDEDLAAPLLTAIASRFDAELTRAGYASLRKLTRLSLPDEPRAWRAVLEARAEERLERQEREREESEEGSGGGSARD
ncbi:MAG: hypothetical protein IPN34_02360 [Planctomycetes bacterium]|nr:hypothetical protein [Planctomycetota bacterium]